LQAQVEGLQRGSGAELAELREQLASVEVARSSAEAALSAAVADRDRQVSELQAQVEGLQRGSGAELAELREQLAAVEAARSSAEAALSAAEADRDRQVSELHAQVEGLHKQLAAVEVARSSAETALSAAEAQVKVQLAKAEETNQRVRAKFVEMKAQIAAKDEEIEKLRRAADAQAALVAGLQQAATGLNTSEQEVQRLHEELSEVRAAHALLANQLASETAKCEAAAQSVEKFAEKGDAVEVRFSPACEHMVSGALVTTVAAVLCRGTTRCGKRRRCGTHRSLKATWQRRAGRQQQRMRSARG
jgi:chromosome segregation ATPase